MRNELIELLGSIEKKELDVDELEIFKMYVVSSFNEKQLFDILNFGIKKRFDDNKEEMNLEVVSNYSLPIRINSKIDLIDSLNYFHHCLFDDGTPCNPYVEERCIEAKKIINNDNKKTTIKIFYKCQHF